LRQSCTIFRKAMEFAFRVPENRLGNER